MPVLELIDGREVEVARGELLLGAASPGAMDEVLARAGGELGARALDRLGDGDVARVALPEGVSVEEAIARVRAMGLGADAWPNAITRGTGHDGAPAKGARTPWNVDAVDVPHGALPAGVTLALLDSGLASRAWVDAGGRAHAPAPFLAGVEVALGPDLAHGDAAPDDENNHGTHLASLLVGPTGLARGARLLVVEVLDEHLVGTEASLVQGLDYARTHGADVVNLSLGFSLGY
ncbi:MAG TPA: S8 family serine peptidase, partial [Minicystis sp.]|nr:S8 family serine peptidase [Minicystis sp.]